MDAQYGALGPKYAATPGNTGLSFIRGKGTPSARSPPRAPPTHETLNQEEGESHLISRSLFNALRRATMGETISEGGSDDEEAIPVDEDPGAAGLLRPVGELDTLTLLLADTPLKKLRFKAKAAAGAERAGDLWSCLALRQQVLALAKLYSLGGPYAALGNFPLLLAEAHFQLASTYADLQCVPQAKEHSNKAQQSLPKLPSGEALEEVAAFKCALNVLLGEMLLYAVPPKPQAALQHMYRAAGTDTLDAGVDPSLRVLVAQCHALLGEAKLQEAHATRRARDALEQRLSASTNKLADMSKKSPDYSQQMRRIAEIRNELREEEQFEKALVEEACSQFNRATELLMEVIDEEETRIRQQERAGQEGYSPLILTLWRLGCEFSFKLSLAEGLAGNVKNQLDRLFEVCTAHSSYGCVPPGLLAETYKERSAALVARANTATEAAERTADLQAALATLDDLLLLQDQRHSRDILQQALSRAETLKLVGNVNVGLAQYGRAKKHYEEALELFSSYLGPDSNLVLDLEHRIVEVQAYDT